MLKVLLGLLDDPSGDVYGLELARSTGLKTGTVYPILERLEAEGLVDSRWEQIDPACAGRPRRRFYRLNGYGVYEARQILVEHGAGDLRWI